MRILAACRLGFALLVISLLTNCGGSSSNTPAPLQITLSPSAPSIAVNSSVEIDAQTTPIFPKYLGQTTWSVPGESQGLCDQGTQSSSCPNGTFTLIIKPTGYPPTGITYYAPSTPGSYQVTFEGQITDATDPNKIDYQGTASVTVTVTAQ
jgi:hypothetical protein